MLSPYYNFHHAIQISREWGTLNKDCVSWRTPFQSPEVPSADAAGSMTLSRHTITTLRSAKRQRQSPIANPQSPIANPQSPIPNRQSLLINQ